MDEKCRTCRYRSNTPHINGCDYILIARQKRICGVGAACTRYEPGARAARDPLLGPPPAGDPGDREYKEYLSGVVGRQGPPLAVKRK